MQALLGIIFLLVLAYCCSDGRGYISWKFIFIGIIFHFCLGFMLLNVPIVSGSLIYINDLIVAVEKGTRAGTTFVFGFLGSGEPPFDIDDPNRLFIFAFQVLPQVLVFTVLVALLWHWRILQLLVRGMGFLLSRILPISGPLATASASSLFLGMVETPLVVRAYLRSMPSADFFAVMTLGMSTVAGSVLVLYASVLSEFTEMAVSQIVAASLMNIVGALYISRLFQPELKRSNDPLDTNTYLRYDSTMDALAKGTKEGLALAVNVGAMVLVLVSLVALTNNLLSVVSLSEAPVSLERIFGWLFSPVAWLIGIPWKEAEFAGSLLGTKLVLNELIAFIQLADRAQELSSHSRQILVYALCGFANFGSLGILLGGLHILVPERMQETLRLAPKSILSGTITTLLTASIVSVISSF